MKGSEKTIMYQKEAFSLKGKILEIVFAFFFACILIYLGVTMLMKIWWILAIIAAIIIITVIAFRIWRFKRNYY